MNDVVVKPSMGRTIGLAVLCVLFTVAGIAMLFADGFMAKIMGGLAMMLFGVGGAAAIVRQLRGGTTFTLKADGIEVGTGGFVPWHNIGMIGQTSTGGGAQGLGFEVLDVPAYVATLTPEQQRTAARGITLGRAAAPVMGAAGAHSNDVSALNALPADDLVAATEWGAQMSGGFHLVFPTLSLNKPMGRLMAIAEEYRAAATGRR